jgi:serine/threonine-protein kinase
VFEQDTVPERIGRYRVTGKLGEGGMGVVYLAYDAKLQRSVAIKLLTGLSDDAGRERLLQEARAASALNHPNICTIYEVDEAADQAFIVMEHIEGKRLSDLITSEGLPSDTALCYGLQIADALAHAHDRRIVHRDVKAANILMTPQGRAKVLDFGLAKRVSGKVVTDATTRSRASLAEAGVLAGTLPYIAPEQLRGEEASACSDIWALGVVLYEMTAGQLPFRGSTGFTLSSAILRESPPPLSARVPAGLRRVIQHCLAKEPGERYQHASEVRAALEALQPVLRRTTESPASRPTQSRPKRMRIRSLAVLPLVNLSPNPEEEYFADGMTDALITTLAQIGALRVISRTSVMQYKGARKPLPEIAHELKVDAVMEGTVVRSGNHVRIAAQLIHAATDTHLWAKNYESDLQDVLSLQGDVARAIAHEVQIQLTPLEKARLADTRPVDPEAYEAFLKGRHHWYKRGPDALKRALNYLQHAVAKDPSYALAHAGVADAYNSLGWDLYAVLAPAESFPKAKEAARTALELDPSCAEAHAALGWAATAYDWDWVIAEAEFQRAIELKPQYGPVHIWYSHFLKAMGRTRESFEESRRALGCDPIGLVLNMHMGWHYLYSREYRQAIEQLLKTLELDPGFLPARMFLGEAYEQTGMFAKAIGEFEETVTSSGRQPIYLAGLGHAYAASGKRDEALETIQELNRLSTEHFVTPRGVAEIYVGLGDKEQAFAWLDRAFEQRSGWLLHVKENPRYDSLRTDPRYTDLVRRMNLQ